MACGFIGVRSESGAGSSFWLLQTSEFPLATHALTLQGLHKDYKQAHNV